MKQKLTSFLKLAHQQPKTKTKPTWPTLGAKLGRPKLACPPMCEADPSRIGNWFV